MIRANASVNELLMTEASDSQWTKHLPGSFEYKYKHKN